VKYRVYFFASLSCAFGFANSAVAKPVLIQSVSLNGKLMSTEGGEARLYRIDRPSGPVCRIEAIHFGEMGKRTFSFTFGSELMAGSKTDYRYATPIYDDPTGKIVRTEKTTLSSKKGWRSLSKDLRSYKSVFGARNLAKCSAR
jgi:hypothetical protein